MAGKKKTRLFHNQFPVKKMKKTCLFHNAVHGRNEKDMTFAPEKDMTFSALQISGGRKRHDNFRGKKTLP